MSIALRILALVLAPQPVPAPRSAGLLRRADGSAIY